MARIDNTRARSLRSTPLSAQVSWAPSGAERFPAAHLRNELQFRPTGGAAEAAAAPTSVARPDWSGAPSILGIHLMSEPGILPEPVPFGKYYLLERVNVGGMAEVYKAKAFGVEGFERLLAIKKILDNIAEDESFINMFIDEAKIAGQLNHPNIAQIFDLGQADDSYFIALEYISGKDLKTQFERARRIGEEVSIPRICYTIMKVCEGLGHAHEKKDPQGNDLNIVHRDVSPQNILVSYEGEVKIIDFGIAKAQGKTSQTQVGILKGKFSYMSPEQVRGLHVDHRSDIFSLGIVMYEMLTLERLFLGESDFDTLEKIRKVEMSPPSLYNPHIPKELEDIVLKALARSPEDRYQSTFELAEDLERFMRNEGYYFTNKDLAKYMKDAFQADIEFEQKKLEYYRSLDLKPIDQQSGPGDDGGGGLSWDDDEMETQIYGRDGEEEDDAAEIDDSDIVYADDIDGQPDIVYADDPDSGEDEVTQIHVPGMDAEPGAEDPTREFDRWDDELDLGAVGGGESSTEDIEVEPRRDTQNTAQVAAVDVSDEPRVKVPASSPASSSRSGTSRWVRIGLVAAVIVAAGVPAYFLLSDNTATVTFDFGDDPVEITVDGELIHQGTTPYDAELSAGELDVEVRRKLDDETYTTTASVEPGDSATVEHTLDSVDLADTGIDVTTDPEEATVYIDDDQIDDPTPAELRDLEPGSYELRVELDDHLEVTEQVDVDYDEITAVELSLQPTEFELKLSSYPDRSDYVLFDDDTGEEIATGHTSDTIEGLNAEATYRVEVDRSYYEASEQIIEPDGESTMEVNVELSQDEAALARRDDGSDDDSTGAGSGAGGERSDPQPDPQPEPQQPEPQQPEPQPEPTGTGSVSVQSNPAARIYINGEDTGQYTPMRNHELPAGRHQITLVNEDHGLDETYTVELEAGQDERVINR